MSYPLPKLSVVQVGHVGLDRFPLRHADDHQEIAKYVGWCQEFLQDLYDALDAPVAIDIDVSNREKYKFLHDRFLDSHYVAYKYSALTGGREPHRYVILRCKLSSGSFIMLFLFFFSFFS
jgi:hypothetical protein